MQNKSNRSIRRFSSHEEAERADREYYAGLTPQQRLDLLFELILRQYPDAANQRLERVCRIVKTLGELSASVETRTGTPRTF